MSNVSKRVLLGSGLIVALSASAAQADILLLIDLTVPNQITINATNGLSSATVSGGDTTGVYFNNFYSGAGSSLQSTLVSGNITNVGFASDGTPALFRGGAGSDTGLNLWSWATATTVTFTAGTQAWQGSGTWTLDATDYGDMLAGNLGGDLYFPADDASDLPNATVIGQWRVIPAPGAVSLFGVGLLAAARRRR